MIILPCGRASHENLRAVIDTVKKHGKYPLSIKDEKLVINGQGTPHGVEVDLSGITLLYISFYSNQRRAQKVLPRADIYFMDYLLRSLGDI